MATRGRDARFDVTEIQQAIVSNRQLQTSLLSELERLSRKKATNRAQAAACTRQLANIAAAAEAAASSSASAALDNDNISRRNGKWTRRFFVDPSGGKNDEPAPNADTLKRRALERASFFYHLQPPWSKKESKDLLLAAVKAVEATTNSDAASAATTDTPQQHAPEQASEGNTIDFTRVAAILQESRKAGNKTLPRTPEECQIQYQQLQPSTPFSKQELKRISEIVSLAGTPFDWDTIADSLSTTAERKRTPWDCLVAYHNTKLNKSLSTQLQTSSSTWSVKEDELLLKFLAAAGPQAVVESKNALVQYTLLNQLLTTKSKKQIFTRANQSLLHPNLKRSDWSDEEERRLPIMMKIYCDRSRRPDESPLDLFLASTHCPGRSTKSVVDKWHRSINPEYSSRPFTRQEDEALMKVMRSLSTDGSRPGWTELSQKHFPDRHPQRLQSRWSELASDQDILDRERALLLAGPPVRKRKRAPDADVEGDET